MEKITFQTGSILTTDVLNELQKSIKFDASSPRSDFYQVGDTVGWPINTRDALKDWELPNPNIEPETSIGRIAYDGKVLGYTQVGTNPLNVIFGPPRTTKKAFNGTTVLALPHAIVEAGKALNSDRTVITWARQLVALNHLTSYLYYDFDFATVVANSELPSLKIKHIPLAKLVIDNNGDLLSYEDLRSNSYIDSLGMYSQTLTNTLYINTNYQAVSWDRVLLDTTNSSLIVTLPSAAQSKDGDEVAILDISQKFDVNSLTLRAGNGTSINNVTQDTVVSVKGSYLEFFYTDETKNWNPKLKTASGGGGGGSSSCNFNERYMKFTSYQEIYLNVYDINVSGNIFWMGNINARRPLDIYNRYLNDDRTAALPITITRYYESDTDVYYAPDITYTKPLIGLSFSATENADDLFIEMSNIPNPAIRKFVFKYTIPGVSFEGTHVVRVIIIRGEEGSQFDDEKIYTGGDPAVP